MKIMLCFPTLHSYMVSSWTDHDRAVGCIYYRQNSNRHYIYHQGWIVLDMSENFRAFELALVTNNLHLQGGQAVNC